MKNYGPIDINLMFKGVVILKKLKIIIFVLAIINVLSISMLFINKVQTSEKKSIFNNDIKIAYYLEGKGDKWQFNDGVLIYDSGKCFFANGLLKNISREKIALKSNKVAIEERNKKNEIVSYLFSRVVSTQIVDDSGKVQYSYEENVIPYGTIQIFEGLNSEQSPIYYKDILHNDLYLIFEYTDINNTQYKEEFKLNKEMFSWN